MTFFMQILVSFIFLYSQSPETMKVLRKMGFKVYWVRKNGKLDWVSAANRIRSLLTLIKPSVVHCHLFYASIIGLLVSRAFTSARLIYTRHHSTFHHNPFRKGLIGDHIANAFSHRIVSISPSVTHVLTAMEGVCRKKVVEIWHGFDLKLFQEVSDERKDSFRSRNGIPKEHILIGVVARFVEYKGIPFIIEAFKRLYTKDKRLHLVLLNATGPLETQIMELLGQLPKTAYTLIIFDEDIVAAYACFACYIHVPVDKHCEAFGQTYVESLAAGVPSVFTLSGIANEFVRDGYNALVVPYKDPNSIELAVARILSDDLLRDSLMNAGKASARQFFELSIMVEALHVLYTNELATLSA